jgi:hypothetical protein
LKREPIFIFPGFCKKVDIVPGPELVLRNWSICICLFGQTVFKHPELKELLYLD